MKRTTILMTAALALALAIPGPAGAQGSGPQEGENGDCLDYNLLYLVDGVHSPLAPIVEVAAGTQYVGSAGDFVFLIDFFDADGISVDYGGAEGEVPAGSVYGVVCVSAVDIYPAIPVPAAAWTYQDGL